MSRSTLPKNITLFLGLFFSLSMTVNACENWNDDLEPILDKVKQGRGFAALRDIEMLSAQCPEVARIPLEQGSILEHLGKNEQAINIWIRVLETYPLPEKVAVKIKLRILQARKREEAPWVTHLLARVAKEWLQPQKQSENNLMLSAGVKYVTSPVNLSGFEFNSTPFLKTTGYISRNQDVKTENSLLLAELGWEMGIKQLRLTTAYQWKSVDQVASNLLVITPQIQLGVFKFSHAVDWDIDTRDMTFNPKLSIRIYDSRLSLESEYNRVNQITTLDNSAVRLSWGKRVRPELLSKYHWVDNELDVKSSLTVLLNSHWMFGGFGEYTFATSSSAKTGLNLSWRL